MFRIRSSRVEDSDRVIEIWRGAVAATHDFLVPADRDAIEAELALFLPTAPLLLASDSPEEEKASIHGFMLLNGAHVDALFIAPQRMGMGVGRLLVDYALSRHPGLTTDVNEQNGQAIGFYRRMGFRPYGRSPLDGQGRPYPLLHLRHEMPPERERERGL
ncbi:MAG: acetyltransferase [Xanthobacter sp.]